MQRGRQRKWDKEICRIRRRKSGNHTQAYDCRYTAAHCCDNISYRCPSYRQATNKMINGSAATSGDFHIDETILTRIDELAFLSDCMGVEQLSNNEVWSVRMYTKLLQIFVSDFHILKQPRKTIYFRPTCICSVVYFILFYLFVYLSSTRTQSTSNNRNQKRKKKEKYIT